MFIDLGWLRESILTALSSLFNTLGASMEPLWGTLGPGPLKHQKQSKAHFGATSFWKTFGVLAFTVLGYAFEMRSDQACKTRAFRCLGIVLEQLLG